MALAMSAEMLVDRDVPPSGIKRVYNNFPRASELSTEADRQVHLADIGFVPLSSEFVISVISISAYVRLRHHQTIQ